MSGCLRWLQCSLEVTIPAMNTSWSWTHQPTNGRTSHLVSGLFYGLCFLIYSRAPDKDFRPKILSTIQQKNEPLKEFFENCWMGVTNQTSRRNRISSKWVTMASPFTPKSCSCVPYWWFVPIDFNSYTKTKMLWLVICRRAHFII